MTTKRVWDIDILSSEDVQLLLRACSRRALSGLRDRALIAVLWGAGLRLAEALALRPKDLDLDRGAITVQRGKGAKRRVAGIDAGNAAILAEWLACRQRLGATRSQPVFCCIQHDRIGRPVSQASVRQMLGRRAKRAGLDDRRVHAHGLRHAHAVSLMADGVKVVHIQRQLGHANLAVTSVYLDHLGNGDTVDAVRNRASVAS